MENVWLIAIGLIAYLLGSFPLTYIIAGKRALQEGSGNLGAMNTYRVTGSLPLTALVFLADAGKAIIAIWLTRDVLAPLGYNMVAAVTIAAFLVVLGHNRSVFLKLIQGRFYGGRGLSSLIGILIVLNWVSLFACLAVMILCIFLIEWFMKKKLEGGFKKLFKAFGSQVLGRFIGLVICLVPLYFFIPQELFPAFPLLPILPAAILTYQAHFTRLRKYLKGVVP